MQAACAPDAVSVAWPVWEWISAPQRRWLFSSYALSLSIRDSLFVHDPGRLLGWAGPIFLRTETRAGRGGGKPITKQLGETADAYAFLARVFGVKF